MKKNLLLFLALYAIQFVTTTWVFAQKWAEDMFEERRHNFGSVALGVEAVHRFKFTNPYPEDIHIVTVTSSCGCTTPTWPKTAIKYGESGEIVAKLNTDGQHKKEKSATLTVVIQAKNGDKAYRAQVQLQITSYIRPDVFVKPGVVEFGSIREGKSVVKKLTLEYAGKSDWKLVDVVCENPNIEVVATEVGRQNSHVVYSITVTIHDSMPSGYVHDMIRFSTNDTISNASIVTIPVHGYVTTSLVAKPSPFIVGCVQPGETVKKNLVLRSDVKFRITKISSKDRRFQFSLSDLENETHLLPITFTADSSLGDLTEPILIQTTLAGQQQMLLLTQGMVYDEQLLTERAKQRQKPNAPAATGQESRPVTELAENTSRMQIRMPPTETASTNAMTRNTTGEVPDPGRNVNRLQPMAVVMEVNTDDSPSGTMPEKTNAGSRQESLVSRPSRQGTLTPPIINLPDENDDDAFVEQKETLLTGTLRPVPQLDPSELIMESDETGAAAPPQVVTQRQPVPLATSNPKPAVPANPPTNTGANAAAPTPTKTESSADWVEVPFVSVNSEPVMERTNNRIPSEMSPVPTLQSTAELPIADFVVMDDTTSARNNAQADARPAVAAAPLTLERSPAELPQSQGLSFSKPSVKDNWAAFTETKPQPVEVSGVFDVLGEPKIPSSAGNALSPPDAPSQESATRIARVTEPPKVPPVPGMRPTTPISTVPSLSMPAGSPNHRDVKPQEAKPQIDTTLPLPPTPASSISPGTSPVDLDHDLIASLLGGTKPADRSSPVTAQVPLQAPENPENPEELKFEELQPLEASDHEPLSGQLVTITSKTGGDFRNDEFVFEEEDSDFHLPKELMPPLEGNTRLNAANPSRERLPHPGDLPSLGMSIGSTDQRQRNNSSTAIAGGAPIPMGQPPRQMGQAIANNAQNVPPPRIAQLPSPQSQPRTMPQQPPPNPLAQQQMQTRTLSQQQVMQQRAVQQQQMQQRPPVTTQPGRTATPTQTQGGRIAQANPQNLQPIAVPPAPIVPNTPMMSPVPNFR